MQKEQAILSASSVLGKEQRANGRGAKIFPLAE